MACKNLYVLVHSHRFGESVVAARLSKRPSDKEAELFFGEDFESDREESVTIIQPAVYSEKDFLGVVKTNRKNLKK